jgi:hypothetical protein
VLAFKDQAGLRTVGLAQNRPGLDRKRAAIDPSPPPRRKWAGELERAKDRQLECFGEEFQRRQIEVLGPLYQLTGNGDRHLGMTFPLELYPRTSTALVRVIKLGLVQCNGNDPLLKDLASPLTIPHVQSTADTNKTVARQTSQRKDG